MISSCLKCPVTALKCHGSLLLTGQKSRLVIYEVNNGKKLFCGKAFMTSSIHRFCAVSQDSILVIGGKSVKVVKVKAGEGDVGHVSVSLSKEKNFNGWIWDGIALNETSYALITAHNTVVLWNHVTNNHYVTSSCEEQCILYSALIHRIQGEVVVAAGTVFNKLLLWKPNVDTSVSHSFKETWKIFHGHEGVIFRVRLNPSLSQLLSISDDRSIRIWDIKTEICVKVLFGHIARVWDAIFTDARIVSVGEDAACIVWNKNGNIVKKFTGHKGKSIWSMDVREDSIFTGGGDGAIRQWHLSGSDFTSSTEAITMKEHELPNEIQEITTNIKDDAKDYPRVVKILNDNNMLIFTNNGLLLSYEYDSEIWTVIHDDDIFSSYCVLELHDGMVSLGNLYGIIKVFSLDNPDMCANENAFNGKIFSMSFLSFGERLLLLATGPEGVIRLFEVGRKVLKLDHLYTFLLPHSKQRWVTSVVVVGGAERAACNLGNLSIICGDRRGSLHLFRTSSQDPVHSMLGVHGKTGVTSVMYKDGIVFSTGRDGSFRKYNIQNETIILIDKQKACKGMDWIEGIWFRGDDVIIYGFYMQSHFALWSFHSNEVLFKVQCGGGYRSWDVHFPTNSESDLKFSYLKGPVLHTVNSDWTMNAGCTIIQDKLHGREILSAKILGMDTSKTKWLLATSSEDTTINFLIYNTAENSLQTIYTAVGHIGGVKDIVFVSYCSANYNALDGMFISCGSRTSLKIWNLKNNTFVPYAFEQDGTEAAIVQTNIKDKISCSLSHEIFNPEMNPKQLKLRTGEFIDDMRYLSCDAFKLSSLACPEDEKMPLVICCVCACSDGVARVYMFQDHRSPQLLLKLGDNRHCVQQVRFQRTRDNVYVFITATDGVISIWDITETIRDYTQKIREDSGENGCTHSMSSPVEHVNKNKHKFHEIDEPRNSSGTPILQLRKHQSGINSLDVLQTSTGFLVTTGGDDNALYVVVLSKDDQTGKYHVSNEFEQQSAHLSSITGVRFVNENLIISTSIDQRVKIWNVHDISHPIQDYFTDVADVSNLEIWKQKETLYVTVTGVGMEILTVNLQQIS